MSSSSVTVLMPVYNGAAFLPESIDSILSQTYKDFEFLIINDGSTDDSEKIILSYDDPRIKYLKNDVNLGVIGTLNRGLEIIKTKYIIRMDADDLALPYRIQVQVDYMDKHPDIVLSGSRKIHFSEDNKIPDEVIREKGEEHHLYFRSIFNTTIPHPTSILRNEIVQKYNIRYKKENYGAEDKAMWLEIAQYGKLGKFLEPLLKYRVHENQVTVQKKEAVRNTSVNVTLKFLKRLGVSFDQEEEKALAFICYPNHCGDIKMVKVIMRLADKLSEKLKNSNQWDAAYIDKFFKTRIINILAKSTSIGVPIIGIIIINHRLNIRNFNLHFYKNLLMKK